MPVTEEQVKAASTQMADRVHKLLTNPRTNELIMTGSQELLGQVREQIMADFAEVVSKLEDVKTEEETTQDEVTKIETQSEEQNG
jgi:hypothetical protein